MGCSSSKPDASSSSSAVPPVRVLSPSGGRRRCCAHVPTPPPPPPSHLSLSRFFVCSFPDTNVGVDGGAGCVDGDERGRWEHRTTKNGRRGGGDPPSLPPHPHPSISYFIILLHGSFSHDHPFFSSLLLPPHRRTNTMREKNMYPSIHNILLSDTRK